MAENVLATAVSRKVESKIGDLIDKLFEFANKIDESEAQAIWAKIEEAYSHLNAGHWPRAAWSTMQAYKLFQNAIKT